MEKGLIDEALLDRSVARVLRHKFMLGLFENPYVDAEAATAVFDNPEQRALAQEIAGKSLVLLKNEGDLLPLPKDLGRIAVIGPNADTIRNLLGDYAYPCHIETLVEMMQADKNVFNQPATSTALPVDNYPPMQSILAGIQEAVSGGQSLTTRWAARSWATTPAALPRRWRRRRARMWLCWSWAASRD